MKRRMDMAKLQARIPAKLKAEAEVVAEAAGQLFGVFVERAIAAAVLKAKNEADQASGRVAQAKEDARPLVQVTSAAPQWQSPI